MRFYVLINIISINLFIACCGFMLGSSNYSKPDYCLINARWQYVLPGWIYGCKFGQWMTEDLTK